MLKSVNEMASLAGADRATVQRRADQIGLVAESGPKGAKLYDSRALLQIIPPPKASTGGGVLPSLEQARTENTIADTKLKELQAAKLEGVLADVEELLELQGGLFEDISAQIKKSNLPNEEKEDILAAILAAAKSWAK